MEKSILDEYRNLYSGVISDILDTLGFRNQVMNYKIRPIYPEAKIVGFAFTIYAEKMVGKCLPVLDRYKIEFEAIDLLKKDDVVVVANANYCGAFWGELLSTKAKSKGARGAIIEGFARDCAKIKELDFPVFSIGITPADSHMRVEAVSFGHVVTCGGVKVNQGDLIFADFDGVVVIPSEIIEPVLIKAKEKGLTEGKVRDELRGGKSVKEVYKKYKVM
ncbi:MAG: RraA family protein [Actinobacteria bacterium]|nr:RraA family protein [Actinomycetota bacterium]